MVKHAYNHSAGEVKTAEIFRVYWSLVSHPSLSDPRPVRGSIPQNKTKQKRWTEPEEWHMRLMSELHT